MQCQPASRERQLVGFAEQHGKRDTFDSPALVDGDDWETGTGQERGTRLMCVDSLAPFNPRASYRADLRGTNDSVRDTDVGRDLELGEPANRRRKQPRQHIYQH